MIPELAAVWQQIIIRAAIAVGLATALVVLFIVAVVAGTIHLAGRLRTPASVPECDEAA